MAVLLPLTELKSVSSNAYERVWKRLDKQPEETKKVTSEMLPRSSGLQRKTFGNWRRSLKRLDQEVLQDIY